MPRWPSRWMSACQKIKGKYTWKSIYECVDYDDASECAIVKLHAVCVSSEEKICSCHWINKTSTYLSVSRSAVTHHDHVETFEETILKLCDDPLLAANAVGAQQRFQAGGARHTTSKSQAPSPRPALLHFCSVYFHFILWPSRSYRFK